MARVLTAIFAATLLAAAACGTGGSDDGSAAAPDPTAPAAKAESDAMTDHSGQSMEMDKDAEAGQEQILKVGRDVGERVLDFSITLEDGTVRTSEELLAAGRPVFIYFMATWCPVCRKDLSELSSIYPDYADSVDFIVVGQDPSEPIGDLVAYRDGQGQPWPVSVAGPGMLADLRITTQAFKLAIGPDGVITYRAGYRTGNPEVWGAVIADLAGG